MEIVRKVKKVVVDSSWWIVKVIISSAIGVVLGGKVVMAMITPEQEQRIINSILNGVKNNENSKRIILDIAKDNVEYMKNYFLKNTGTTSVILNGLLPERKDDIKAILRNVSADTRKSVKDILTEISEENMKK